jgi:hypothetical protein
VKKHLPVGAAVVVLLMVATWLTIGSGLPGLPSRRGNSATAVDARPDVTSGLASAVPPHRCRRRTCASLVTAMDSRSLTCPALRAP